MEVINVMHNNEYISKLDVVRILQKAYAEGRIKAKDGCVSALDDINALPAIGVQPVKRGRWIHDRRTQWKCSNCGNFLDFDGLNCGRGSAFFCPNCGADMREPIE